MCIFVTHCILVESSRKNRNVSIEFKLNCINEEKKLHRGVLIYRAYYYAIMEEDGNTSTNREGALTEVVRYVSFKYELF